MKKVVNIVGARPQFVKAAMVSRGIKERNFQEGCSIDEYILHTGQHYDTSMSDVFFKELGIPQPKWTLRGDSGETHASMTGRMLVEIETILMEERPHCVIVYGDTNSTLAGALAAVKLNIPVMHVEAGLRSFNRRMPEEINRVMTDHISTILCCPTRESLSNLAKEGIHKGVNHVGDVMYDAALMFGNLAATSSKIMKELGVETKAFRLCTIHRAENTDDCERLESIVNALREIADDNTPVIMPLHPRTRERLTRFNLMEKLEVLTSVRIIPPTGFMDMVMLEKNALTIITDSGGMQKEAYFHKTQCITLRDETEWTETVNSGWNMLAGYRTADILKAISISTKKTDIDEYGQGNAADKIAALI